MVDTGASLVALTYEDASRAGIYVRDRDFTQLVRTANGIARVAPVTLDRVSIGDITVRNVPASVSERGMLGTTLLGMSFLKRLTPRRHARRHAGAAGMTASRRLRSPCHQPLIRHGPFVTHRALACDRCLWPGMATNYVLEVISACSPNRAPT